MEAPSQWTLWLLLLLPASVRTARLQEEAAHYSSQKYDSLEDTAGFAALWPSLLPSEDEVALEDVFALSAEYVAAESSLVEVASEGDEVCGYGKDDLDYIPDYSLADPRSSIKKLGWAKGLAARLVQLGTHLINTRVIPIELTGQQAQSLIEAAYGIVTVAVPKECFRKLRLLLDNKNLSMAELKRRRGAWRRAIKHDVVTECLNTSKTTEAGKIAKFQLQPLRYGYWTLYEPSTDASKYIISAQATDEKRFPKRNFNLRQIWHYAKMHLVWKTSPQVRKDYLDPTRPNSELKRLRKNVIKIARAMTFAQGRMERVELGSREQPEKQRCLSAPLSNTNTTSARVQDLLRAVRDEFRVTVMVRERLWQKRAENSIKFLRNPWLSWKKFKERIRDEFHRQTIGGKLGMIIMPLSKLAMVAGLALGAATAGSATFLSLFVDAAIAEGAGAFFAYSGTVDMLVSKVIMTPVDCSSTILTERILSDGEGFTIVSKILKLFDDSETIQDVRFQLQAELEKLMEHPQVQEIITNSSSETENDPVEVEELARRHLGQVIAEAFAQQLVPKLYETYHKKINKGEAEYGWLAWEKWRRYREGSSGADLKGKQIMYRGRMSEKEIGFSGVVYVNKTGIKWFGLGDRTIRVWTPGQGDKLKKTKLTDELKLGLWVKDKKAFELSQTDWLSYDDWLDYTPNNCRRCLKRTHVRLDPDRLLGKCGQWTSPCARSITSGSEEYGALVTHVSWGVTTDYRMLTVTKLPKEVYDQEQIRKETCEIPLSPQVARCLAVMDPAAYQRYQLDEPRRSAAEIFHGQRNESAHEHVNLSLAEDLKVSLQAALVQNIRDPEKASEVSNEAVLNLTGQDSVEFDVEEHLEESLRGNKTEDEEVREVQEAIDEGFEIAVEENLVNLTDDSGDPLGVE
mmetsp:Transcript_75514/g.179371  ORF Transcript_75514/g.179371 Transcript_75514/m.179371 type:complete len:912 (+) Transcript_75514:73-2808(+)